MRICRIDTRENIRRRLGIVGGVLGPSLVGATIGGAVIGIFELPPGWNVVPITVVGVVIVLMFARWVLCEGKG